MTIAIRSPDARQSRSSGIGAVSSTTNKVTPIGRDRLVSTIPQVITTSVAASGGGTVTTKVATVKVLPNRQLKPLWLRALLSLQRTSSLLTFLLLGCTLTIYGSTVYDQQRWTEQYQKLETLRRNEQQLNSASVVLKHQIAATANDPATGLMPQQSSDMIFLVPAPERPAPPSVSAGNLHPQSTQKSITQIPLGY
jgi:hypothetical protein